MKKRPEDPPKGAPAWQSTFSDLMNLLLCFFVLLFSMSTVDAAKFQMVVASMQSSISIMPAGSLTIGEGELVGGGVSQLEFLDNYYNELANSRAENEDGESGKNDVLEQFKEESLSESEEMAEQIQSELDKSGIHNMVDVNFTAEYVQLNLFTNYDELDRQYQKQKIELQKEQKKQEAMISIKKKYGKKVVH